VRDPDITSLRLFAAVCDARSIARAAESHAIVASAVSKRLAALEQTVGAPLLQRRRHGVVPTVAGETLLEHARAMLASVDRIARDMQSYAGGIRGHVRLLASASALAESLADDVADFLQQPAYRDIRVDLEERVSQEVVQGIAEGSASLGICWDAVDRGALHWRAYRSDHLAIVTHPTHPVAGRASLRFAEVLGYEQVGLPLASAVQRMLHRAAALAGQPLVYRVLVANFETALRVVRAGLAISVVPAEAAELPARAYGLRVIPLDDDWARRSFGICCRDPRALQPAAAALLDHLERAGARERQEKRGSAAPDDAQARP